jgi:predicted RNA methylase
MLLAPYVSTSKDNIRRMLEIARVSTDDVLFDLGSGDGRILITAVREFKVKKAIGIEIREDLVNEARTQIRRYNLERNIEIIHGDALHINLSMADVVTLYLTSRGIEILRPKLEKDLKAGTRIVSLSFQINNWKPVKIDGFWFKIYLYQR